mmetsp:Transcript_9774/g.27267  ORF Transcript_9774/g.27267 Transcript_9774/m.27267 type:complete len:209 (-) Transcript_9774:290-916(-)
MYSTLSLLLVRREMSIGCASTGTAVFAVLDPATSCSTSSGDTSDLTLGLESATRVAALFDGEMGLGEVSRKSRDSLICRRVRHKRGEVLRSGEGCLPDVSRLFPHAVKVGRSLQRPWDVEYMCVRFVAMVPLCANSSVIDTGMMHLGSGLVSGDLARPTGHLAGPGDNCRRRGGEDRELCIHLAIVPASLPPPASSVLPREKHSVACK